MLSEPWLIGMMICIPIRTPASLIFNLRLHNDVKPTSYLNLQPQTSPDLKPQPHKTLFSTSTLDLIFYNDKKGHTSKPRRRSAAEERQAREALSKRALQRIADEASSADEDCDDDSEDQPPRILQDANGLKRPRTDDTNDSSDGAPTKKRKTSTESGDQSGVEKENVRPQPRPAYQGAPSANGSSVRVNVVRGRAGGRPPGVRFTSS